MDSFVYEALPGRIVFGPGRLSELPDEIDRLGCRRALVITTPGRRAQGDAVAARLGDRCAAVFNNATMHVPVEVVDEAQAVAGPANIDCLVSLGGGSTTGLAKALALRAELPIIAIPTTYAGSEMSTIWGLTEKGAKRTGKDRRVLPATVIYDPELTLSLPPDVAGPSGVNSLAHCVEALYSVDANPVTTLIAEEGIRALSHSLPAVVNSPDDRQARAEALYGAYLSGTALGAVGMALHHKLCHTLGGSFNLPHAEVHTIILPYATRYNSRAAEPAMARIRRAMGTDDAARGLYDLNVAIGAKTALTDIGFDAGDIDRAAELATQNSYPNPAPVTHEGIVRLLQAACDGTPP